MKEHKNHTKTFQELTYREQANSLNAQEINLKRQFQVHFNNSNDKIEAQKKLIKSAERILDFAKQLK